MSDDTRAPPGPPAGGPPAGPSVLPAAPPGPGASPPAVAIRITRPYGTEAEFLEHELDAVTRSSVTLVGAQPRALGAVLRFELVLSTGQAVLRGEGRVVAFKPNVHRGVGGLTLRFTRLDSRSKALVDKIAALRDQRRPPAAPGSLSAPPPAHPSFSDLAAVYPSSPSLEASADGVARPPATTDAAVAERPRDPATEPPAPAPVAVAPSMPPLPELPAPSPARRVLPPDPLDREALLDRLRLRAKALAPADVQRILDQRRRA